MKLLLDLSDRSQVEKSINGAIRSAIEAYGPLNITKSASAAKRVYSELKAVAKRQRT
jgi:hypothetical protein